MADSKHTLYANASQTKFYWIPDDKPLPAGSYMLRSLTGARIEVDEAAAEAHKITEDRAKELTRDVVAKVAQRAGSFLSGLGAMMQDVARKQSEPRSSANAEEPTSEPRPGEGKPDDPDVVVANLRRIWEGLQATAKEAATTSHEVDVAARERLRKLVEVAGANLDAAEAGVDELGGKLREVLEKAELERRIGEATKRLRELAEELGESFRPEGNRPSEASPAGDNRPAEE